jgi:hypothetical protein
MTTEAAAPVAPVATPPAPVATPTAPQAAPAPAAAPETSGTALGGAPTLPAKPVEGDAGKPTKPAEVADIVLKFPDGMQVDKDLVDKFTPIAKELGLKSDQAQKIANLYAERIQAQEKSVTDAWANQQKSWAEANRKDPEIGGPNYDANVAVAREAISKFGGEALRKEIDELGIGDNPALLKAWVQIGKATGTDKVGRTGQPVPVHDENAVNRKLYPSMFNADGTPKT